MNLVKQITNLIELDIVGSG